MSHEVVVQLAGLGLCEHCGALLTIENMPAEALDTKWHCPSCSGVLSLHSFGYKNEQGEKVQWVGPNGKWTTAKPTEDFTLGSWYVTVQSLPVFLY